MLNKKQNISDEAYNKKRKLQERKIRKEEGAWKNTISFPFGTSY